jgi:trans-aconitate 2-methyltransferase
VAGERYSFGDTGAAARRLDLVSRIFDPPTVELLRGAVTAPPALAVDLGCGPGNTTRLVRDVTAARRTVGLDRSPAFIAEARERSGGQRGIEYIEHDVTKVPFPVTGAEVIFARLVLAHLPDVPGAVAAWSTQLAPRGRLVLDEVERIDTSNEVFGDYLRVVTGMIAARGADMYAGRHLAGIELPDGMALERNARRHLAVPTAAVAEMFALNLSVWRGDPWVVANHEALVQALPQRFDALMTSNRTDEIAWELRQVVVVRAR